MSDFFFDPASNVIVYPGQPTAALKQAGLQVHEFGQQAFAVPRTLENVRLLAHWNYPVPPIMDDASYNWPIERGKKPLPHQRIYANFTVLHPRMFNLGDAGCVAGDTLIETDKGKVRIDELARGEHSIKVFASTERGVQLVKAERPFAKGFEPLYRVTFASGKTIDVTAKHWFLTCRGWTSCADLEVGEQLPKFDADQPASTSESYLSMLRRDDPHLKQTILDFPDYSYSRACDGQLLEEVDSDLTSTPSQAGSLERNRLVSRTDVLGNRCKHIFPLSDVLLSNWDSEIQTDCVGTEYLNDEFVSRPACNQLYKGARSHRLSFQPQQVWPNPEAPYDFAQNQEHTESCTSGHGNEQLDSLFPTALRLERSLFPIQLTAQSSAYKPCCVPPFDLSLETVVHIAYLKTDVYYDMHVPVHYNYIAHGVCNHNSMKTLATLWAMDFMMRREPTKALIIAPVSILDTVWAAGIVRNLAGKRTFKILTGDEKRRSRLLAEDADCYIINPDGIKVGCQTKKKIVIGGFAAELAARKDIGIVIIDEATAFKDAGNGRSRIFRDILGDRPYIWQLTATPTAKRPTDAYGMAKIANNAYGKSFRTFQLETELKVSAFKWVPQKDGYEKARRLLAPAVRFSLDEVWDGPEMTFQKHKVELTPEQKKAMGDLKRDLQVRAKNGTLISAANEAAARQKFMQISLGAVYDENHKAHVIDAAPRYNAVGDIIDSTSRKAVIFVPITSVIHLLKRRLEERWRKDDLDWTCDFINGEVSAKQRPKIINAFASDPKFKAIICDPVAAGHGINEFVVADTVIWMGAIDKAEPWIHANARIRRPGQLYPSNCFQIVSNKLEEEMFDRLEKEVTMQGLMLDAIREGIF